MNILRPVPTGIENKLPNDKLIFSKTDAKGGIVSASQSFVELSGYKEGELITSPHSLLRHPDMPKTIFKVLWDRLDRGLPVKVVIKNLTKCGNHFWSLTSIEVKRDRDSKEIRNYIAYRTPINSQAKETIIALYKQIKEIEEKHSIEAGINFLLGYLDERKMSYDDLMEKIENGSKDKGILTKLKNIF
ncbi:MAG: PAS domain-containing protein [Campylobacterales bacterium]|nr:PAS domain-containing protein [Campylobacterales bacterium]